MMRLLKLKQLNASMFDTYSTHHIGAIQGHLIHYSTLDATETLE